VVAFHGPAVMAGLAQLGAWPAAVAEHVRTMLFAPAPVYRYPAFGIVTEGYPDWRDRSLAGGVMPARPDDGWRVLQGSGAVEGPLWGGCIEVVDWLRGTWTWPPPGGLDGALLCLEPSEEKPGPDAVARMLRSMAAIGVVDEVAGVLLGRPRDHTSEEASAFEAAVVGVIGGELGRRNLPIVANVSFGHTDPQWVLPMGVRAAADLEAGTLTLLEPWLD
jgi:muramoyltetrapeptide carboxypeptidase LdcA involved in peptidoglycan recycling